MFCDSCGAALQAGQGYCVRCGKQVIGPVVAGSGRVARHTHLLAILWIAYSAITLIAGFACLMVSHTIFGPNGLPSMPGGPPLFVRGIIFWVGVALMVKGGVGIFTGIGLLQREGWARVVAIAMGVIALFSVPFGTALGIYTLWVLVSPNADVEYQAMARGAGG
jgi:hypothetical protein